MQTWTNLLWAKQSEYFKCTKRITNNNSITGLSSTNLYNYTNNQTIQTLCHSTTNLCTAYITNKLEKGKEEMELYTHNHHPPYPLSPSAHLWGVLCTPYNHVPVCSDSSFKATSFAYTCHHFSSTIICVPAFHCCDVHPQTSSWSVFFNAASVIKGIMKVFFC